MWGRIFAGLAVTSLITWIVYRSATYRRIFADAHFVEVAQGIVRLKAAALSRVIVSDEDEVRSPTDLRTLITSAGLVLVYTIRRMDNMFVHHCSISLAGGYTAHAVGESFTLFVAKLLGVPFEQLALGVGRSTVHHAEFHLSEGAEATFAARSVPEVSPAVIKAFRNEWIEVSKRLQWNRL